MNPRVASGRDAGWGGARMETPEPEPVCGTNRAELDRIVNE